ncbi:MAG: class II aldolase/adducin family protein, partial [Actinobacteria bacterium]|nr:class II aldolase/adducin family protein [Actinomycetota bacterium]
GVVHTHSTYGVAWAARGEEIPCVITAMADEFGGPIPVGPFAIIGDDSIGRGIVETLRGHRSRGVLMQNHGPFTIGKDAEDAVKAAVMLEDVARTVHIAQQGGPLIPIPQEAIDSLFHRYQNVYGQAPEEG